MDDADRIAGVERIRAQTEKAPYNIKKLERIRRLVDVGFACIFSLLVFKATTFSGEHQKALILLLFAAPFSAWVFFHLHLNQLLESEEAHSKMALGYLYAEELRSYSVANIEALFNAVNELAEMPKKESLPSPPAVHIQQGGEDKPLGTRERTNLLNIIGVLVELIQTTNPKRTNETVLIAEMLDNYSDKSGIKERTLQEKFAAAKRSLLSN